MVSEIPSEIYDSLFRNGGYRPITRVVDLPATVRQMRTRVADPDQPLDQLGRDRPIYRLILGGQSDDHLFIYYESWREYPWGCTGLEIFRIKNDAARLVVTTSGGQQDPITVLKNLITWGLGGIGLTQWTEHYDTLFKGTGYTPIRLVDDIPQSVGGLLLGEARRAREIRGRSLPTDLHQVLASPGQPYNAGCAKRGDRPNSRLIVGVKSKDAVFLHIARGGGFSGPGPRDVEVFELAGDEAHRVYASEGPADPVGIAKTLVTRGIRGLDPDKTLG